MSAEQAIGIGVVGLGFMGRTHVRAYAAAAASEDPRLANRLVALSDRDPERFAATEHARGNLERGTDGPLFDPESTAMGSDPAELFANDAVELVSICTHTDTHVELALQALEAGKHVVVEKPVALRAAEVERLANAARASDRLCMPAMCMRFWPGWDWLHAAVESAEYGPVHSAVFRRLGSHPAWSPSFYSDPSKSGGALFDLHVHDSDFVRWLFGTPASVTSHGTPNHLTTSYSFDDGPEHVLAEGGWDHAGGFEFQMSFTVVFEDATVDFALGRPDALRLARAGKTKSMAVDSHTGYDGELRHALLASAGLEAARVTMHDAVALARVLEAEEESLRSGTRVDVAR